MNERSQEPTLTTDDDVIDVCDACNGTGIEEGEEWAGTRCRECNGTKFIRRLDPDEPPEPDGECYRGREYASASAEEQAWIQRNLK